MAHARHALALFDKAVGATLRGALACAFWPRDAVATRRVSARASPIQRLPVWPSLAAKCYPATVVSTGRAVVAFIRSIENLEVTFRQGRRWVRSR